jgi:hypothetical protein
MIKTTLYMITMLVMGVFGIIGVSGHATNDAYINCPDTPTPTCKVTYTPELPTSTPTDTATATPVTPTDTPTSTSTPVIPTPTDTPITPTSTPVTPTDTPVTPTSTPVTPDPGTPTATYVLSPTPTDDPTSTPTATATLVYTPPPQYVPTNTPYPPKPAVAGNDVAVQLSDYIGLLAIGNDSFGLYKGVNAPDGSLYLPSMTHDAALYHSTIWVHRLWNEGWLRIPLGTFVHIEYKDRTTTYTVSGIEFISYGIYPETAGSGIQYIATCYRDNSGEWAGVELYQLELTGTHAAHSQR